MTFRFKKIRNNTLVNRINLWLFVCNLKDKCKSTQPSSQFTPTASSLNTRDLKVDGKRSRRQGKLIKIRVFLSDANNSRGQRVAELRTRIKLSNWGKLGLPVSLINTLAVTDTLRLRVECKRCTRNIVVVLPGSTDTKRCKKPHRIKKKKKKEKRMRKWRKHCAQNEILNEINENKNRIPFLVIEEKSRSVKGRLKRSSGNLNTNATETTCSDQFGSNNKDKVTAASNVSTSHGNCCTEAKIFVDFAEMGLDQSIVYPTGFEFSSCISNVSETASVTVLDQLKKYTQQVIGSALRKVRKHPTISSHHSLSASHSHLLNTSNHHFIKHQQTLLLRRHSHRHYQQHTPSQGDSLYRHKLSRLKMAPCRCDPVERRHLVILYLRLDHSLASLELPGFVVSRCGCKCHFVSVNK